MEGKPGKAYKLADQLLRHMTNQFISGPGVGRYLGVATVLKAIAAYQLGDVDEAFWHWHVACQLWPEAKALKMTAYGDAGPALKGQVLGESTREDDAKESKRASQSASEGKILPPRKKKAPPIHIPASKRRGEPVSVLVQVVIGTDGRPHSPKILQSKGEPTLVFAALDSLRKWEFEPAMLAGKPVAVYYNLAVNFRK